MDLVLWIAIIKCAVRFVIWWACGAARSGWLVVGVSNSQTRLDWVLCRSYKHWEAITLIYLICQAFPWASKLHRRASALAHPELDPGSIFIELSRWATEWSLLVVNKEDPRVWDGQIRFLIMVLAAPTSSNSQLLEEYGSWSLTTTDELQTHHRYAHLNHSYNGLAAISELISCLK